MSEMARFFDQAMRLPMALFAYGIELLTGLLRAMPKAAGEGMEAMVQGIAGTPRQEIETTTGSTDTREEKEMLDRDLSGDDLKLVRHKILFVKRDYEVAFAEKEDLVTYGTRPEEYGGLKVAEFMEAAAKGQVPRPEKWKTKQYPPAASIRDGGWTIPEEDRKYVKFFYEVLDRYPREAAEYDREKVEVLREISRKIG